MLITRATLLLVYHHLSQTMSLNTISLDSQSLPKDLLESCTTGAGFFYLSEHGIPQDLIDSVFDASGQFFSHASLDEKMKTRDRDGHTGWTGVGEEV